MKMQESTMMFFTVCLLTLVINIATIQPVHGLEESSTAQRTERIRKRSYSPWASNSGNSVSLYDAGNVYKPASYSLSRPYYIPVYGSQGKTLIYYPPQPIYLNPGAPSDNQFRGAYRGPAYIPPKVIPNPVTPNPVPSRMGGDDDDSDRPVWGSSGMVQMPLSGEQAKEWSATPTRPPMASRPARPPLIHDMDETQSETTKESPAQRPPIRTTTFRPTTQAPSGPSNCVWAIISCCSASNPSVLPQNCFEQRGCPGPFWGDSPCKSDFARAAIAAAVDYYSSNPNAAAGETKERSVTPTRPPITSKPLPPPLVHDIFGTRSVTTKEGPAQRRPIRTTTKRPTTQAPSGPSNCVWAIISCCSASNPSVIPQNCFEQRGCPGPFWGPSPCNSDIARAAISVAVDYYNSNPGK